MGTPCPCCGKTLVSGTIVFRYIDTLMVYRPRGGFRPLGFMKDALDPADRHALEEISSCDKSQWLFNYVPEYEGVKKRRVIVIDRDEK